MPRFVLLSGMFGALLLIAADLSTLYEVDVLTVARASISGHSQHSWALALIGLAGLPMTVGASRASRPALVALAVLGLAGLVIAVIAGDFHDVGSTGAIGRLYENATARPGRGFYFETLGAVLLVAGGLVGLAGRGRRPDRLPGGVAIEAERATAATETTTARAADRESGAGDGSAPDRARGG